jgi:nitroimidazol reductase NimA-like FMN-containing flavoprotein (pyridoxamine 5'-phosphate oxidase superfamily)
MTVNEPATELDARYSDEQATATPWDHARERLEAARLYWVVTVRPDGRPHITPALAVWLDQAMYFSTGPEERKARNLDANPQCALLTGCNDLDQGMDLVVEGRAVRVRDHGTLQRLADAWESKYGEDWHFEVRDEAFHHAAGEAHVYEVAPAVSYGFGKDPFSQTRWTFPGA